MQQVECQQVQRLAPFPEDLLGVEGHLLCSQVAADGGDAEQQQVERVDRIETWQQGLAGE